MTATRSMQAPAKRMLACSYVETGAETEEQGAGVSQIRMQFKLALQ